MRRKLPSAQLLRCLFGRRRNPPEEGPIFISYRWDDSQVAVDGIGNYLRQHFGEGGVFQDIQIEAGEDYRDAIRRELGHCYAVLVVIGRRWLDAADQHGRRRLDNPNDMVRREVEFALEHDAHIRVIPVLVEGAQMPRARELPESIHRLAYRIAAEVRPGKPWPHDMSKLAQRLERPRLDRFGRWPDIRPDGFPLWPLIVNALTRPYSLNLLVPLPVVVAGFVWTPWLWPVAVALYLALATTTLFDLQQARFVRECLTGSDRPP
jgi:TIR domain